MKNIKSYLIAFGVFVVLMLISFIGGCVHGRKQVPEVITHTVILHDTIIHHITDIFPYYVSHSDTIIYKDTVFKDVDTAAILKDHFALHVYDRKWNDTLVNIWISDTIAQNRPYRNDFSYKILRPQTITNHLQDNSVTYLKYLYGGFSLPLYPFKANSISNINYISVEAVFAYSKGYIRANWQPYTGIYSLGTGIRLIQFK